MDTLFVGQNIINLKSVDSTNSFLVNASSDTSIVEGTLVVADEQYQGRGQRGNSWQSERGKSLTFSVLLYPKIDVNQQFSFNKCISLAVCQALRRYRIDSFIKWPNDIFVHDKKVAGILIENSIQHKIMTKTVVGIGINVNNEQFDLSTAISLKMVTSKVLNISDLLGVLCEEIEKHYLLLKSSRKLISQKYNEHLYKLNSPSQFIKNGKSICGIIKEVDDSGRMVVEMNGVLNRYSMGELRFDFF